MLKAFKILALRIFSDFRHSYTRPTLLNEIKQAHYIYPDCHGAGRYRWLLCARQEFP